MPRDHNGDDAILILEDRWEEGTSITLFTAGHVDLVIGIAGSNKDDGRAISLTRAQLYEIKELLTEMGI
jgi:hypothetical protein